MAHKALVGGTAYEIKGGRCLVNGTGYGIQKGRTLVDGTGYDIKFGPGTIPVTITNSGDANYCYVKINETKYWLVTSGLEVEPGSTIELCLRARSSSVRGYIYVNGNAVKTIASTTVQTYKWTVPEDCGEITIEMRYGSAVARITVTTT